MATVNKNFKTKYGIDSGGKITGPASTTDSATLNIPHGVDPTSPVNGDIWTTTSELYARINGSTRFFLRDNATNFTNAQNINSITGPTTLQLAYGTTSTGFTKTINIGPNGASGSTTNINIGSSTSGATNSTTVRGSLTVTGKATTAATTTTQAGLNLPHGTAPSAPVDGDLWTTTAGVYARVNGSTIGPLASLASPTFTGTPTAPTATAGTNTTQVATTAFVQTAVATSTINTQTASYTLVLTDAGKIIEMNVATANNLTVPLNSSVAFPIGTTIDIVQYGAGQTTIVATPGVTLRSADTLLNLSKQYSGASLYKRGTDEWVVIGDLA